MRILDFCQLNSLSAAFLQSFAITALKEDNFADNDTDLHALKIVQMLYIQGDPF